LPAGGAVRTLNTSSIFAHVFTTETVIAAAVFAAVTLITVFAVIRYRDKEGRAPSRRTKANVLEACVALGLLGFAIWLTVFTASANSRETGSAAPTAPVNVDVLAYQWSWRFTYPDDKITVNGAQIGSRPTLVIPAGRAVDVTLHSKDVVHEFWVPELKFKQEAFPGYTDRFSIKVDGTGTWVGRCSVYCGIYHYQMQFLLKVVTPAQYSTWTASHHGSTITAASPA
jgi:cytochrome c oxidase subunit 2